MDIETTLRNAYLHANATVRPGGCPYSAEKICTPDFKVKLVYHWDEKRREVAFCSVVVRVLPSRFIRYFSFNSVEELPAAFADAMKWVEEKKSGCQHPSEMVSSYPSGRCYTRYRCTCGASCDRDSGD